MTGRNDGSDASGGPTAADADETTSLTAEVVSLSEQTSQLTRLVTAGLLVSSHKKEESGGIKAGAAVNGSSKRCRGTCGFCPKGGAPQLGARGTARYLREPCRREGVGCGGN